MNDLISRQAAIDEISARKISAQNWYNDVALTGDEVMLARAETALMSFVECFLTIKKLPSVQPEQSESLKAQELGKCIRDGIRAGIESVQPEIIRCRECKYYQDNHGGYPHPDCKWDKDETPDEDDFCSFAERRE